jgi:hypothetical protein
MHARFACILAQKAYMQKQVLDFIETEKATRDVCEYELTWYIDAEVDNTVGVVSVYEWKRNAGWYRQGSSIEVRGIVDAEVFIEEVTLLIMKLKSQAERC